MPDHHVSSYKLPSYDVLVLFNCTGLSVSILKNVELLWDERGTSTLWVTPRGAASNVDDMKSFRANDDIRHFFLFFLSK